MRTLLPNPALIKDNDMVRIHNRRNAVRYQNDRGRPGILPDRTADLHIRLGVDRRKRIVEHHDRRFPQQHLRDRSPLLLSAGQGHASLTDKCIVTRRKTLDRIVDPREFGRMADLIYVRLIAGNADIFCKCP